jgi:hypothetical protein
MRGTKPNFFPFLLLALLLATGIILTDGSEAFSQSAATVVAIANMEIGTTPADFKFAKTGEGDTGKWTVVADETSLVGRVIEQSSTDRTDYRFPLAIFEPVVAKNIDVSVRFKPVAGRVDQAAGIAVRLLNGDNYYVVRANALEDNVRFYRVVKGRREQIAGTDIKVASNEWHALGIKAVGEHFTIEFDGKTLFTTSDKLFEGAGRVALWTKSDSVTRFDQIALDVLE